jgi:hypothetical protein
MAAVKIYWIEKDQYAPEVERRGEGFAAYEVDEEKQEYDVYDDDGHGNGSFFATLRGSRSEVAARIEELAADRADGK